jgi:hypothetical protein
VTAVRAHELAARVRAAAARLERPILRGGNHATGGRDEFAFRGLWDPGMGSGRLLSRSLPLVRRGGQRWRPAPQPRQVAALLRMRLRFPVSPPVCRQ